MDKVYELHKLVENHLLKLEYYQKLSGPGRSRFRNRVVQFLNSKTFIGRDGLEVTTEMMVWVSAAAVQLTFGLREYILPRYNTILLYPESFYYRLSNQWMKGYTATKNTIALSWADFKEGYRDGDDNYNLGLHELAHALHLSIMSGHDSAMEYYFARWEDQSHESFVSLKKGSASFLRKYGGTNKHEFFAVCVEYFFESPEELKRELPDIYFHLAMLLRQDVSNEKKDFAIDPAAISRYNETAEFPIPIPGKWNRSMSSYRYREWHWTLTVTIIGMFIGSFIFMQLGTRILLPMKYILGITASLGVLAFVHRPILLKKDVNLAPALLILYGVFGIGLNTMAILTILNVNFHLETHKEKAVITGLRKVNYDDYRFTLQQGKYKDYPACRRFDHRPDYESGDTLEITLGTGITGFPVFISNEVIPKKREISAQTHSNPEHKFSF